MNFKGIKNKNFYCDGNIHQNILKFKHHCGAMRNPLKVLLTLNALTGVSSMEESLYTPTTSPVEEKSSRKYSLVEKRSDPT